MANLWPVRSIKGILASSLFFLLTVPGIIVGLLAVDRIESRLETDIETTNLILAESLAAQVNEILSRSEKIITFIGRIPRNDPAGGGILKEELITIVQSFPAFSRLLILDMHGIVRLSSRRVGSQVGYDLSRHPMFAKALNQAGPYWSLSHIPIKGVTPSVTISRRFDEHVVTGYLDLAELSRIVHDLTSEAGVRAVILDRQGTVVAGSDPDLALQRANFLKLPLVHEGLKGSLTSGYGRDDLDNESVIGMAKVTTGGFMVVVFRDAAAAFAPVSYVRHILLAFLALVLMFGVFVVYHVYRRIKRPLDGLAEYTDKVAAGNYDMPPRAEGLKEFDHLERNFVLMTRAVSARETALQEARLEAEAAARAKSEFLANMSHEIRTPMNAVIGLTHLVRQTRLTEQQRDYLKKIDASSNSLLRLIDDILDFSKIDAGRLELLEEPFVLDEILELLNSGIAVKCNEKGLAYSLTVSDEVPPVLYGDALRFRQVLLNLASNAVKFTHAGEVAVTIELQEETDDTVTLLCSVLDTGIGLAPDRIDKLFRSFYQADSSITRKYGGTGLGLAISKRLVQLMGGDISVESLPDRGSTFRFTACFGKIKDAQSAEAPACSPEQTPCLPPGCRVLLVEDNEVNMQVADELLSRMGIQVSKAVNGQEALDIASSATFDAVLMDIQMPVMDGLTATRELRKRFSADELPILAMTANAMARDRMLCKEAGMNDHIPKPIRPGKLHEALLRWIKPTPPSNAPARDSSTHRNTPPTDETLPNVPGLNVEQGLSNIAGNVVMYKELLETFLDSHRDCVAQLNELLDRQNIVSARRLVHSTKGSAATIGAESLYKSARELESALDGKISESVDQLIHSFISEATKILKDLDDFLQPYKNSEKNDASNSTAIETLSETDIQSLLKRLQKRIQEGDATSHDDLQQLKDVFTTPKQKAILSTLELQLKNYDFEQAHETILHLEQLIPTGKI